MPLALVPEAGLTSPVSDAVVAFVRRGRALGWDVAPVAATTPLPAPPSASKGLGVARALRGAKNAAVAVGATVTADGDDVAATAVVAVVTWSVGVATLFLAGCLGSGVSVGVLTGFPAVSPDSHTTVSSCALTIPPILLLPTSLLLRRLRLPDVGAPSAMGTVGDTASTTTPPSSLCADLEGLRLRLCGSTCSYGNGQVGRGREGDTQKWLEEDERVWMVSHERKSEKECIGSRNW